MLPKQSSGRALAVVLAFWDAVRDRAADAAVLHLGPEVEFVPAVGDAEALHGVEAVRDHLQQLVGAGQLAEMHTIASEDLGRGRILLSGAIRVRRPDNWMTTVERTWLCVVDDDLIVRVTPFRTHGQAAEAAGDA